MSFIIAVILILVWAISGPFFGWSDTHSLLINTITTIITFLMVFIIQYSQNKDTKALHLKIDELIKHSEARDELMGIEKLSEEEIEKLKKDATNR